MNLQKNIQYVKGVGDNRAKVLSSLNIHTVEDMITYFPRTYEDRSMPKKISELEDEEEALIEGLALTNVQEIRANRLKIYKLAIEDETGICYITWYNQSYIKALIKRGNKYKFFGKVKIKSGRIEMASPVFDSDEKTVNTGKIIPIYPSVYNLSQGVIRKIMQNALEEIDADLEETLPDYIIQKYNLCDLSTALKQIHFPESFEMFEKARIRLVFEELLLMQLKLLSLKNQYKFEEGISFDKNVKLDKVMLNIPFKLTKAQLRVLEEIENDMESSKTMNRLMQGDVGSGKTILAILAAYKAAKSGYQVSMMVPTAILAEQHLVSFKNVLEQYNLNCEILTSGISKKQKEDIIARLADGEIDVLIGTHAVLEENVVFKNLGLVITDEQHRFGVRQRGTFSTKGKNVDTIVMTATPIPRTLALILFGDLDISVIDELPPNRKSIDTFAVRNSLEQRINNFISKEINAGRQAYIVCPLIEENEEIDAESVLELVEKYKTKVFSNYRVEYLHGKMKPKEKNAIMTEFKNGNIDVLISTTVIEVGVDVPNATIMVIENAERFGLAQLHQLRGRVGRGEHKSYCILKYTGNSELIRKRMEVMTKTNDGFKIAEKDLELRGIGEFFGTKQHGIPDFKIANLFDDMMILSQVQALAIKIIGDDPKLDKDDNVKLKKAVDNKFEIGMTL
ncbi:MAG: ATP-dependent DNA helicase RecG [Oscillospiraceae bacterium]|nr:ATP-dependent DNA helicase RecG [Oscillospiraceae bacterium]